MPEKRMPELLAGIRSGRVDVRDPLLEIRLDLVDVESER